jgi:hypothetical protein
MLLETEKIKAVEEPAQPDVIESIVEAPKTRRKVEN